VTPHLPLPDDETASSELRAVYASAREQTGSVMAILRAMGPRAEVVEAFVAFAEAALYGPAALGRRERELVAVTVSRANGAAYSREVHQRLLDELGGDTDSAIDRALVAFARRLAFAPAEVADAVADLREHLTDDEVHDAITVVGLMSLANRAALATGITEDDDL
jgi:uncharacterized peroxidase-related enzyme